MTCVDHIRVNIVQHIGTHGPSELVGRDVWFLRSSSLLFYIYGYNRTVPHHDLVSLNCNQVYITYF